MKQRSLMKRVSAVLMAATLTISTFPQFHTNVYAAENQLPTKEQFATAEELKTFDTNDGTENKAAKVYFGANPDTKIAQQWWIAGSQNGNVTLFAASPLATRAPFKSSTSDGTYDGKIVNANHYGASDIKKTVKDLETSYFTGTEQGLMNNTTIYTNDTRNNNSVYSTTDKLYLAYGDHGDDQYITVGANSQDSLKDGLRIDKSYWGNSFFWLRAPYLRRGYQALIAHPGKFVGLSSVDRDYALVPAFELNLSSVIFASAASAATSEGTLATNDAFTLRHKSQTDIGTATISQSKGSIAVTDVTNENTYLVVQNSQGVWSKKVSSNDLVFANEMSETLTSFENCKVWLETTNERITYASEATQGTGDNVKVNVGNNLTINGGNTLQTNVSGDIIDITIKTNDGYYLPEDYINNLQSQLNGLTVTETDSGFTITGTPTSDVNIILPAATQKVYDMILEGNGIFATTCVGYEPITSNEFTITNNGNVDLENVKVEITGTNADTFELSWDNTTLIQPNGTMKVTVKPANDLAVNTYQATLSVSADNVNAVTTNLQFTVSEHDYNAVVTLPTCTEKGYKTYTCKNCSHSYVGDEVNAKGHTFGEWEIIDSPTCEQSGSRKHTCTVCGFSETENLNPNGHTWEDDYTVDKEPTCVEDGSKSIHCKNCNAVKDSTTIAKLGHSFTNYVSDNNATCTKDGTKTAKCERCDKTDTRVQENSALGHKLGEWKVVKEPTTAETGIKERRCERCDYKETEVISMITDEKPTPPTKPDNKPSNDKDSPETGDQTNIGLFTSLITMSGLGIAVLAVLKKKKALEHK